MNRVIACIDGAAYTQGVCDLAVWAARRLEAPLRFLHVVDHRPEAAMRLDYTGAIGLGAQETLLHELVELDERRNTLLQAQGREVLEAARVRAVSAGLAGVDTMQRNGDLVETLLDIEPDTRLFVMGQHPQHRRHGRLLGHHLENAVRSLARPVMVAAPEFSAPQRFMVAVDGSPTAMRAVEAVAGSPLLRGLGCSLVMAGGRPDVADNVLTAAATRLEQRGFDVETAHVDGDAVEALDDYAQRSGIGLLVMGAYGHSRIREFILGSTTTAILRGSRVPVVVLR